MVMLGAKGDAISFERSPKLFFIPIVDRITCRQIAHTTEHDKKPHRKHQKDDVYIL